MNPLDSFRQLFGAPRALIGMIHVGALPGTPAAHHSVEKLAQDAVAEARAYREAGFTAIMIENMHDRPYLKRAVGPEITAALTAIGREVKREVPLPLGVQVLAGANREALAVAHAIGAERVRVFVDVKKKHSAHAITADVSLAATAQAAEFFLADGVVVTGDATGEPAAPGDVAAVARAVALPVFVGSGLTPANLPEYAIAHAFIVGSWAKRGGVWSNPLDREAVQAMADAFAALGKDA